ncbi:MAG: RNA polymerase sigma factor [Lawsonibacter sp.]
MDFDLIYQTYFKDVFLYMCSLSADKHIAEEITQETFTKVLKSLDRFDGKKDIRAWLFTIAKNTYFNYCKHRKIFGEHGLCEERSDPQPDLTERLADEEAAFRIHQYLHKMKETYKEVFSLRVFGELSFEKIALIFGKSPSWARVVFYRAKMQIKEYMEVLTNE